MLCCTSSSSNNDCTQRIQNNCHSSKKKHFSRLFSTQTHHIMAMRVPLESPQSPLSISHGLKDNLTVIVAWINPEREGAASSNNFHQLDFSPPEMDVQTQWVAFWKALIKLYRLVVVLRHNIDLLSSSIVYKRSFARGARPRENTLALIWQDPLLVGTGGLHQERGRNNAAAQHD